MKTAISIPDELFGIAERLARHLGMSRSELYQRAVAAFVHRHRDDMITRQLDDVYTVASNRRGVDAATREMQAQSMHPEEW